MDAPAMLSSKHVPENIAAEEGGQQQMHRDEKQHKPVLKKVKDKVRKIKNTIAGHGHGNGHDHGQDTGGSNSTEEDEEDAAMREAEVEKGGYQEDVEDKPIFTESSSELHGAPMYDSERIPAAAKEVKNNDAPGVRLGDLGAPAAAQEVKSDDATGGRLGDSGVPASAKEVKRDDTPGVRLGDLGGPVVEDPAAPRGGEDIGATDAVRNFEAMTVSDDPKQVGAGKMDVDVSKEAEAMPVSDGTGEEWNDAPADAEYAGSYTDRLKNTAAGTTEYGKKLASTVYEKVAGVGTVVASKAQQVTPGFGAGGNAQDDSGATAATAAPEAMTAGAGKRNLDSPAMYTATGTEELKNATTDATTESAPGATYTDKIKSAASTVYEKVAGSGTVVSSKAQQVTPGFGAGRNAQDDSSAAAALEPLTAGAGKRDLDLPKEGTAATNTGTEELRNAATDATTESAPGATYTDKIKSAAAGTTEYGKKLASTVYEKVAGAGTAVASKAQQVTTSAGTATPGVGAQDGTTTTTTTATVTPGAGGPGNGQDKGVTGVTAYIAEKLRPGDEERSLSEAITGAVQQRKEGVGSTVAKAREVPAQAVTRARGAVTSLTGGNRVSETVQPTTEGNIGEGVAEEGPVLHGAEVGAPRTNTNVM